MTVTLIVVVFMVAVVVLMLLPRGKATQRATEQPATAQTVDWQDISAMTVVSGNVNADLGADFAIRLTGSLTLGGANFVL